MFGLVVASALVAIATGCTTQCGLSDAVLQIEEVKLYAPQDTPGVYADPASTAVYPTEHSTTNVKQVGNVLYKVTLRGAADSYLSPYLRLNPGFATNSPGAHVQLAVQETTPPTMTIADNIAADFIQFMGQSRSSSCGPAAGWTTGNQASAFAAGECWTQKAGTLFYPPTEPWKIQMQYDTVQQSDGVANAAGCPAVATDCNTISCEYAHLCGCSRCIKALSDAGEMYTDYFEINDVIMPIDCRDPSPYTLTHDTIGDSLTAEHTALTRFAACPELTNLQLTFENNGIDETGWVIFDFEVQYFNFTNNGNEFQVRFPEGIWAPTGEHETFLLSNHSTVEFLQEDDGRGGLVGGTALTNMDFGLNADVMPNISIETSGEKYVPSWTSRFNSHQSQGGNWAAGTRVAFRISNVTNPWLCSTDGADLGNGQPGLTLGEYCVRVAPWEVCVDLTNEITKCPVLKNLQLQIDPSRYATQGSSFYFTFDVEDYPLGLHSNYKTVIDFPEDPGFDFTHTTVDRVLGADKVAGHLTEMVGRNDSVYVDPTQFWNAPTMQPHHDHQQISWYMIGDEFVGEFAPAGITTYGWVPVSTGVHLNVSNITLPDNEWACRTYPGYNITIGPFRVAGDPDMEVTGCFNISELYVTYSQPYYAWEGTTLNLTFDVGSYDMLIRDKYMEVSVPYHAGYDETFYVRGDEGDFSHMSINHRANKNVTLFRGHTYTFEVDAPGHNFTILNVSDMGHWVEAHENATNYTYGLGDLYPNSSYPGRRSSSHRSVWYYSQLQADTSADPSPDTTWVWIYSDEALNVIGGQDGYLSEKGQYVMRVPWNEPGEQDVGMQTLWWGDPKYPETGGYVNIVDPPRGLQLDGANVRFGDNVYNLTENSHVGEEFAFMGETIKEGGWKLEQSTKQTVTEYDLNLRETMLTLRGSFDDMWRAVPIGQDKVLQISGVTMPMNRKCGMVSNITLKVDWWSTVGFSENYACPEVTDMRVYYGNSQKGTHDGTVYVEFYLDQAPMPPNQWFSFAFPAYSGLWLSSWAAFGTLPGDWSTPGIDEVRNWPKSEISVSGQTQGTEWLMPGQWHKFSIVGVNLPSEALPCIVENNKMYTGGVGSDLVMDITTTSNYTLTVDEFYWHQDAEEDVVYCTNITWADVYFTESANHSTSTDAVVTLEFDNYVDPDDIYIVFPTALGSNATYLTDVFDSWTVSNHERSEDGSKLWARIQDRYISANSRLMLAGHTNTIGNLMAPGRYQFRIHNLDLPASNCTDLGLWHIQIGDSLYKTFNPASDIITECPMIEDVVVTFSPTAGQGTESVNMTVSFRFTGAGLGLNNLGDWKYLQLEIPEAVGIKIGQYADVRNVFWPNNWPVQPQLTHLGTTSFRVPFNDGAGAGHFPGVGQNFNTSFMVTDVHLPSFCADIGTWEIRVGQWIWTGAPVGQDGGSVITCPLITNLDVQHIPGDHCYAHGMVNVSFNVEKSELPAGSLKLEFPAASGLTLWPYAIIKSGPGDWTLRDGTDPIQYPGYVLFGTRPTVLSATGDEISLTQHFATSGTALPIGRHSFVMTGLSTPCNNCTDLGYYRLSVDQWASEWTNPDTDQLVCPNMISNINVSTEGDAAMALARGQTEVTYTFMFKVPTVDWNEIRVSLPEGFDARSTTLTAYHGLSDVSSHSIVVEPASPRHIQIRDVVPTGTTQWVAVRLANVTVGNKCGSGTFGLAVKKCGWYDRSNGITDNVRLCPDSDLTDGFGSITTMAGMPQDCDLCSNCRFWRKLGGAAADNGALQCNENNMQYQAPVNPLDDTQCQSPWGTLYGPYPEY